MKLLIENQNLTTTAGLKFYTFIKCTFEQLPSMIINTNNFKLVMVKVIKYLYVALMVVSYL